MQVGDKVVVLVDIGNNPLGRVHAGAVGTIKVSESEECYYEVEFDDDKLYIVQRTNFRRATSEEIENGFGNVNKEPLQLGFDDYERESPF